MSTISCLIAQLMVIYIDVRKHYDSIFRQASSVAYFFNNFEPNVVVFSGIVFHVGTLLYQPDILYQKD